MSSPFDALAPRYAELWSEAPDGRSQRAEVWKVVDKLFSPGQHVLDLGCGIGDDALHLSSRGVRVSAFDAAPRMVAIAQSRGVDASCLAIESLTDLTGRYDGALSNFSAFDCVQDVHCAGRALAQLIRPGGIAALCVFNRFSWRHGWRRWTGHATWRGIDVYYRSRRQWMRAMAPGFDLKRSVPVGQGDHQLYIFERRRE